MPNRAFHDNGRIAIFALMLILAVAATLMLPRHIMTKDLSTFLYCAIVISWALTVDRRIVKDDIRRLLLLASCFMVLLFLIRICRYEYFADDARMDRMLLYAYYVPVTAVPVISLIMALRMDGRFGRALPLAICFIEVVLCIGIMTNDLHHTMYTSPVLGDFVHGPLYVAMVAWMSACGAGAFGLLMRRCRFSAVRRLWYIPALGMAAGVLLLLVYFLNDSSSPTVFGMKLYHFQEAFCFLFIISFESWIQIGLIPSNSGYAELFSRSPVHARIESAGGDASIFSAGGGEQPEDADHMRREAPLSGGKVVWTEDITAINRLNSELAEVIEELREENELIRHENALRAERIGYDTKNRLYDMIAEAVRGQACRVRAALQDAEGNEASLREKLMYAGVAGAYIKRMGNLMLIADESSDIGSDELANAIRESFEYLTAAERVCELTELGRCRLRSELVIAAYELFEHVLEGSYDRMHACAAEIKCEGGLWLTVAADAPAGKLPEELERKLTGLGAELSAWTEDETYYYRLSRKEDDA